MEPNSTTTTPPAEPLRRYLLAGLEATPKALPALLAGIEDAELDRRPNPERFTLREVMAHLAEWEDVWYERIARIQAEDRPFLPGYDEGEMAVLHDYAHADFAEQLAAFVARRARLTALLRSLPEEGWTRAGVRGDGIGPLSTFELAAFVLGHDGYHVQQIVDYRGLPGSGAPKGNAPA